MTYTRKTEKRNNSNAVLASVHNEMAKPRITKSAKMAKLDLDTTRIPDQPSVAMHGTVDTIIPSSRSRKPEKAQIGVDGADQPYRGLRLDNTLTDEHGEDVKLKKGAHVKITITAKPKTREITLNEKI